MNIAARSGIIHLGAPDFSARPAAATRSRLDGFGAGSLLCSRQLWSGQRVGVNHSRQDCGFCLLTASRSEIIMSSLFSGTDHTIVDVCIWVCQVVSSVLE